MTKRFAALGLAAVLAGCAFGGGGSPNRPVPQPVPAPAESPEASAPAPKAPTHADIEYARDALAQVEASSVAVIEFPVDIQRARTALAEAERIWDKGKGKFDEDDEEWQSITHLAYLARQRAAVILAKTRNFEAERALQHAKRSGGVPVAGTRPARIASYSGSVRPGPQAAPATADSPLASSPILPSPESRSLTEPAPYDRGEEQARRELQVREETPPIVMAPPAPRAPALPRQEEEEKIRELLVMPEPVEPERRPPPVTDSVPAPQGGWMARFAPLQPKTEPRGVVLTFGEDRFKPGRTELQPGSDTLLGGIVQYLNEHPDDIAVCEGYSDVMGENGDARGFSAARARAVQDALLRRGLDVSRVWAVGYGDARPVAGNDTAEGRRLNRRVEVVIQKQPRISAGN